MCRVPYTEKEVQFIKDNYNKMTDKELAEHLGRTKSSIENKRLDLGLIKGHLGLTLRLIKLINKHASECESTKDLVKFINNRYKINITESSVRSAIYKALKAKAILENPLEKMAKYRKRKYTDGAILKHCGRLYIKLTKEKFNYYRSMGAGIHYAKSYVIPLTHKVWIDSNGLIEKEKIIIQIDHNKNNVNIDNLRMVDKSISLAYNKYCKEYGILSPKHFDTMCLVWSLNSVRSRKERNLA